MISPISVSQTQSQLYIDYLDALASTGFRGDIEQSYASRLAVATDNSVYQSLPQAVLLPKDAQDVVCLTRLAAEDRFKEIQFSARGGGTGTNGQSLTSGIIVDLSRHMNQILEINEEERWVRVQTGVVKDQLNAFLKPYGFFFSPDLSTSNRATIGGMINTDASGQGSLVYGKTSDHVLGLESVLASGETLSTAPVSQARAQEIAAGEGSEASIYAQLLETCIGKREQILDKFPRLNRFLTGYDLEHVIGDDVIDASRVLTGSEGSLAIITEAKLNLTPIPKFKTLVNIKFDSFEAALRASPTLVKANATSVETVDSKVLNLAKEDIIWHSVQDLITDVPGKDLQGLDIVEYTSETQEEIDHKLETLHDLLKQMKEQGKGIIGYQITDDPASIQRIYAMRKKAVGLLGAAKGRAKPIAFAEDTAVPPENLADFILEFRDLLDSYSLSYGMFGHVDAGVLHVRPAMDMSDPSQEVMLREISDKVVALTAKYGGLMWGEHGKGYRSEYGPAFFGDALFTELRKIKSVFDPLNKMNPGKICTPLASAAELVSVDGVKRGYFDRQIPVDVRDDYQGAMECNGNGLCFNYDAKSPMCPSFKITGDRRHSPKGRAGLMREWLRLASKDNDLDALERQTLSGKGPGILSKLKASWGKKQGDYDFSHEVKEAMDGCLACKACSSACPIKVDVPNFRARFLQLYHSRYMRPLKDYLVANVERMAPVMAKAPKLVNQLQGNPLAKGLIEKTIGYVDAPTLSVPALDKRYHAKVAAARFDLAYLSGLSAEEKAKTVCIVQDPFTSFYEAELIEDLLAVLDKLGVTAVLLPFKPNGKPEHVKGFLTRFAKTAADSAGFLNQLAETGVPMIGIDASLVLCYRDEYNKALGDKRGAFKVELAHEWLHRVLDSLEQVELSSETQYTLLGHCSEKTALPNSEAQWQQIFALFGLSLTPQAVGCCGMAGTYGHESHNQDNSIGLYNLSWKPVLDKVPVEQVLATGFSCRSQVKRLQGQKPQHPIQALKTALVG